MYHCQLLNYFIVVGLLCYAVPLQNNLHLPKSECTCFVNIDKIFNLTFSAKYIDLKPVNRPSLLLVFRNFTHQGPSFLTGNSFLQSIT